MTLRAPFPWYGSKLKAAALIERLHGDVNNLVIPCAGSIGELLGRSKPAKVELINDLDGLVVNAWRAIKHSPERIADLVDYPVHELTLHAVHDELVHARTTKGLPRRSLKSGRRRTQPLAEYLREDERNYDARIAARWIWGASCWLGSGWCKEPANVRTRRQVPHLTGGAGRPGHGKSVHARTSVAKTWRARPQLSHTGHGVTPRKVPRIGGPGSGAGRPDRGRGVTPRQMPMLSGSYDGYPGHGMGVHSSAAHRQGLLDWMEALAERLRFTRIICGDWRRALTPATTTSHGLTGVSFDPTYDLKATGRSARLYRKDDPGMSTDARAWCIENGGYELLRIALCGKHDEHDETLAHGWTKHVWRPRDGETIWASPHCRAGDSQRSLF